MILVQDLCQSLCQPLSYLEGHLFFLFASMDVIHDLSCVLFCNIAIWVEELALLLQVDHPRDKKQNKTINNKNKNILKLE